MTIRGERLTYEQFRTKLASLEAAASRAQKEADNCPHAQKLREALLDYYAFRREAQTKYRGYWRRFYR